MSDEDFFEFERKYNPDKQDFRTRPQMMSLTNEYDIQSYFLQPGIKLAETVGKGIDEEGNRRTGFVPTGLSELNTVDLQTGILSEDERKYINVLCALESLLLSIKQNYKIDVSSAYDFYRSRIGTYMSTTKSKNGFLVNALTTKKILQQQNISSTEFTDKKGMAKDKIADDHIL